MCCGRTTGSSSPPASTPAERPAGTPAVRAGPAPGGGGLPRSPLTSFVSPAVPMPESHDQYVLEFYGDNGDALGRTPVEMDWLPAVEYAHFSAIRAEKVTIELNKGNARKLRSLAIRKDVEVTEMAGKILSGYLKRR